MKTSLDHPLRLDAVVVPGASGRLLLTICPGKKTSVSELTVGGWDRDLGMDVEAISRSGALAVLTLLETEEMASLAVPHLSEVVQEAGLEWLHFPIRDKHAPDADSEEAWASLSTVLHQHLDSGHDVVVHCNGGVGRTGTIAALLLMERGVSIDEAIAAVRAARGPVAVENEEQDGFLRDRLVDGEAQAVKSQSI